MLIRTSLFLVEFISARINTWIKSLDLNMAATRVKIIDIASKSELDSECLAGSFIYDHQSSMPFFRAMDSSHVKAYICFLCLKNFSPEAVGFCNEKYSYRCRSQRTRHCFIKMKSNFKIICQSIYSNKISQVMDEDLRYNIFKVISNDHQKWRWSLSLPEK